ncbi:MAG: hypothetical protein QMC62_14295 [Alteromonadaceae bacterium]
MNNNDYKLTNSNGLAISIKQLVETTFNVKAHNNELYISALVLHKLGFSHLDIIKNLITLKEGK